MVKDWVNDIKKDLRASMNGVASAFQRHTADYRVNWGVELPRLAVIADEARLDSEGQPRGDDALRQLSQALWNESTRECKILACMLMPAAEFGPDLCDTWAESIRTEEIATMFCLYLTQRLPYASAKAFEWMAAGERTLATCGFLTLCHLMRKYPLGEAAAEEFLDQAAAALDNKYSIKALRIFASLSEENAGRVKKVADYL